MNRKPNKYWIPFWIDKWLFGSTRLELTPDERSVWLDLLALASKNDGFVRANDNTPYPPSQLAGLLVIPEELLQRTIDKCIEYDKVTRMPNNTLQIVNWKTYQISKRHKRRLQIQESKEEKSKVKKSKVKKSKEKASVSADVVSVKADTERKPRCPELQSLIDFAESRGFGLQGSQRANRQYAYNILRKKTADGAPLGLQKCQELVLAAVAVRGQPYAPVINDFKTLFYKYVDLIAYVQKHQQGGRIG